MTVTSTVGMNLAGVNYWATEYPFIDRMKTAGSWTASNGNSAGIQLNKDGYPISLPSGAYGAYAMIALDPPSANTDKVYVLTYTGTATIGLPQSATVLSSAPGKITFRYDGTNGMQGVVVSNLSASDPLTAIHVVREDQQQLYNSGEIFNPDFLSKISPFDTLRYMGWDSANDLNITSWSQRTTMSSMSWADTSTGSVPIEVQVALANKTHTNMWVNIPTMADDDYVRQMMTYIHNNLDPTLKVQVEYSNEVWNWSFSQSKYAANMANQLWGKDVNGDGKVDPNNSAEAVQGGWEQYYGYRSAQIASIAHQVFGSDAATRLDDVIAVQTVNQGLEQYIFQGIARANLGSPSDLFSSYAVTTYFGSEINSTSAADRAKVLSWARSGQAGLDAAFNELQNGGTLTAGGSLASLVAAYAYQAAVASKNGLNLVAYEGGSDLGASNYTTAEQPEIMAFIARLQADPRMGDLYTKMVSDFSAAGGTQLNVLADAATPGVFGAYGTLKTIYDAPTPAYTALVNAQATAKATRTTKTSYVFGATERTIAYAGSSAFQAVGNALGDDITGGSGANTLTGGAGNDTLTGGRSADLLDGGAGADRMVGKGGNDVYIVDNPGDVVVEDANAGNDEVRTTLASYTLPDNVETLTYTGAGAFAGTGNALANTINGGNGGATLAGGAGNDTLNGGNGADYLDGGTGDDVMTGGAGNDVYVVDSVRDTVNEAANGGYDEVRTSLASYTLGANVEKLTYTGTGAFTGTGNALVNTIVGGSGPNKLYGGDGNDLLIGGAGNDLLDGGSGADTMIGGAGNDTYIVDSLGDIVTELPGGGTDEVRTNSTSYTLGANVENLTYTGITTFYGTGNELANIITAGNTGSVLNGGAGNDTLIGGNGNDYLDGGTGADRMSGGLGNDTYIVDDGGDVVTEASNGGTDTVRTALASYVMPTNVENLVYTGTGGIVVAGNASDNVLTGGPGANKLYGNDGRDTLIGGAGNDTLDGGTGADRMVGGLGDDAYFVDNPGDIVVENPNEGSDTVYNSISYTLGANLENLRLTGTDSINGTGNDLANVIIGNAGANQLAGGAGDDLLNGGDGNDRLDGGAGNDNLFGAAGDDVLIGGDGNDVLDGGAGNDTLIGGRGNDAMSGGAGADRFVFAPGDLGTTAASTDVIFDFTRADGDKIDLSAFDAKTGTNADDAFTFLGTGAFTKHAGELRIDTSGYYTTVYGDTNGDGVADFALNVSKGSGALIASDFVL